jgi:hypothetical protein
MKAIIFEGAIALDTLLENCQSVPWVARTPIEDNHDHRLDVLRADPRMNALLGRIGLHS